VDFARGPVVATGEPIDAAEHGLRSQNLLRLFNALGVPRGTNHGRSDRIALLAMQWTLGVTRPSPRMSLSMVQTVRAWVTEPAPTLSMHPVFPVERTTVGAGGAHYP
jgi:hypothetical protein